MSDTLVQAFLAIIGITAIILVARKNKWGLFLGCFPNHSGLSPHLHINNGGYSF